MLVASLTVPGGVSAKEAAGMFLAEMGGGAAVGVGAGYAMLALLRWLKVEPSLYPVLALAGAMATFGGAQRLGTSGFLATYLVGIIVGNHDHQAMRPVERFFETLGWLSQIVLFLMLGLLVNPHELVALLLPALLVAAVLILVARPAAAFCCLLPFGFSLKETSFVSWVGLRGGVPIYLTIIPLLAGVKSGDLLFGAAFVIVIASLIVQGWTVGVAARVLGFGQTST